MSTPNALLTDGSTTGAARSRLFFVPNLLNDFLLPLVILSDPEAQTLPLVQFVLQSQRWVISGVVRGAIR